MPQVFTILKPEEVNIVLWEQCLRNNEKQASIYMHINYLNVVPDNWLAIVNQDYSIITAIPFRKKWCIHYTYTSPFIQSTSIIGNASSEEKKQILRLIQKKIPYGTISLNNIHELGVGVQKNNFVLSLDRDFKTIKESFSNDLQQNIKKAANLQLLYTASTTIHEAFELYQQINGLKTPHVKSENYSRLIHYCSVYKNDYCIRLVKDRNNNTLAIALLLKKFNRLYNILNTVTEEGRAISANHFLLSNIIEEFSGSSIIFDFEGSSIPGIQKFYQGFNPVTEYYTIYHYNKLFL